MVPGDFIAIQNENAKALEAAPNVIKNYVVISKIQIHYVTLRVMGPASCQTLNVRAQRAL